MLNGEEVAFVSIHQVAKRVPTVVGISELTTHNAIRRAKFAEQVGADAVMVLPISYWKLSEREVFQHYAAIAQAISIPIMVYNNPATSGIDLSPELIARMVKEIDNVTMVKESTGTSSGCTVCTSFLMGLFPSTMAPTLWHWRLLLLERVAGVLRLII